MQYANQVGAENNFFSILQVFNASYAKIHTTVFELTSILSYLFFYRGSTILNERLTENFSFFFDMLFPSKKWNMPLNENNQNVLMH